MEFSSWLSVIIKQKMHKNSILSAEIMANST